MAQTHKEIFLQKKIVYTQFLHIKLHTLLKRITVPLKSIYISEF